MNKPQPLLHAALALHLDSNKHTYVKVNTVKVSNQKDQVKIGLILERLTKNALEPKKKKI